MSRLTLDWDVANTIKVVIKLTKCLLLVGKKPDFIGRTRKGYHIIYHEYEGDVMAMREKLGDDKNRIRLDRASDKRQQQVLFTHKKVTYFNSKGGIKAQFEHERDSEPLPWILTKLHHNREFGENPEYIDTF